jgi:hypothetical protein
MPGVPVRNALIFVFLLLTLLPYLNLVPALHLQIQPWAALVGWLYIVILWITQRERQIRKTDVFLLLISGYFLLSGIFSAEMSLENSIRKSMVFTFSLGILFLSSHVKVNLLRNSLLVASIAYFLVGVLHYASTDIYQSIIGVLVDLQHTSLGERGTPSLTPESTDFGFTMVYFVLIAMIIQKVQKSEPTIFRIGFTSWIIVISIICIAMSKSASGYSALFIVLSINYYSSILKSKLFVVGVILFLLLISILLLLPSDVFVDVRGIRILREALLDPSSLLQTSFAHRALHNIVALIALVESKGVGFGAGSFIVVGPEIYDRYGLADIFGLSQWHRLAVKETLGIVALGVIPLLLTEYGVIGAIFAYSVFSIVFRSNMPCKLAIIGLLSITWLQSFPAAYPPFWLLVGLSRAPDFAYISKKFGRT